MGRHRAGSSDAHDREVTPAGRPARRWPVLLVVVVAVVAIGWFTVSWVGGLVRHSDAAAAATCPAGNLTIQIAVAPAMAAPAARAAAEYNAGHAVSTDHCVEVRVSSIDPQDVLAGLTHGWDTTKLGPKPHAWLADSTLWTGGLAAVKPAALGDSPQSVATSPVVLAMPPDAAKAVLAAGAPTWDAVPKLVADANGWAGFNEPGWGQVTLALPTPATNAATTLAVEAMLDPPTPQGQAPLTQDLLNSAGVRQSIAELAVGQPNPVPASTRMALRSLGAANSIASAPFAAVPVTEFDLYQRNVGADGAGKPANVLDEVRVSGPTPFVDYPYVPLAGDWVSGDEVAAAQHFRDFLLTAPQQAQFARAGLRVASSFDHPRPSPGLDWGSAPQEPSPTDAPTYQRLVAAWGATGQAR